MKPSIKVGPPLQGWKGKDIIAFSGPLELPPPVIPRNQIGYDGDKMIGPKTKRAVLWEHYRAAYHNMLANQRLAAESGTQAQKAYLALREALQQARDMRMRAMRAEAVVEQLRGPAKRKGKK